MRFRMPLGRMLLYLIVAAGAACAQNPGATPSPKSARAESPAQSRSAQTSPPDILVEVPKLNLDSLSLVIDSLDARLFLNARIANLVQVTAQADITIDSLALNLAGLDAEALVAVRLDNLTQILIQLLATLQKNPELAEKLLGAATPAPSPGSRGSTGQPIPQDSGTKR